MQVGPYPAYPDDAEVPEGTSALNFHIQAASEIRAAGNDLFKQVDIYAPPTSLCLQG